MWTDEKVKVLKDLWGKGKTASQIAEIIGGLSRNAVIGKAHRLNLSAKLTNRSLKENISNRNLETNKIENKSLGKRKLKKKLMLWNPNDCPYKLCCTYLAGVGYFR